MIDNAHPDDGPQLVAVTADVGVFTPEEVATVDELWNDFLRQGEASGYHFVVYRDGERVLGYACYGPRALTEGTFDLYWIVVSKAAQGRGIARALMAQVETEIRRLGGRLMVIETSGTPEYEPARRLYAACGCAAEAVIRDFYRPGDDLVIFTKHL